MTDKPIPPSVLALLNETWKDADPRNSAFELVFGPENKRGRIRHPSYYFIRRHHEHRPYALRYDEAASLCASGALGSAAKATDGIVVINEHAQHALFDFCSEVYAAWGKYQKRLADLERYCPETPEPSEP